MNKIKRILFRFFLCSEMAVILLFYLFGSQGIAQLFSLKEENSLLLVELAALENDVDNLESEIAQWKQYPFYKEKIAREQLHMAYANDTIFYLP